MPFAAASERRPAGGGQSLSNFDDRALRGLSHAGNRRWEINQNRSWVDEQLSFLLRSSRV